MDNSIKITTQELKDTATKVRTINANLKDKLDDIKATMNGLEATWQSDAAEDIRAAMNALDPNFDQYWSVVNSYATFLDDSAAKYETTEGQIQNAAGAFK